MQHPETTSPKTGLWHLTAGVTAAIFCLVGVLGGWAATTQIAGAVIATGQIDVAGKPKVIQTVDGGVLAELTVQSGDIVKAGQVLARFDAAALQIDLRMARARLADAIGLRARLEAERDGSAVPGFDTIELPDSIRPLDMTQARAGQSAIFKARAQMRAGMLDRISSNLDAVDMQVTGINGQIFASEQQLAILSDELTSLSVLVAKGLAPQVRLSQLQSSQAGLRGDLAARRAELAQLIHQRGTLKLERLQADRRFQEEVALELREVNAVVQQLVLTTITRQAQMDRIVIRAPADGMVHELRATTVGGVVAAGATLMDIVPQREMFEFEVRVDPRSINLVRYEQSATIVLSAFDPHTTPRLTGTVRGISPKVVIDPNTGESFYRISLEIPNTELSRLPASARLVPGMPIEAFLKTGDRTVLSYLAEPISSQLRRGFRG